MTLSEQELRLIQECLTRYKDAVDGAENTDAYILEQKIDKFLRRPYIELKSIRGVHDND